MFPTEPQTEEHWEPLKIRVSRENRTLLCRPDWDTIIAAIPTNAELLAKSAVNIQGRTLSHLRDWTATQLIDAAVDFTASITGERNTPEKPTDGFVVGGHQPSLFHPGVWAKNFAIHHLAASTNRRAINLVVDNDSRSSSSLRVPAGSREKPLFDFVPFDSPTAAAPWEDAGILDGELFATFGDRIAEAMSPWGIEPIIQSAWPDTVAHRESGLRDAFTAVRSQLERRWGVNNLELPISRMCELDPFLWFAGHLFAHADRFRDAHNRVLNSYRVVNRIRSRTHPVPELTRVDGWTESPFWIWRKGEPIRRRAFVRQVGREVELTDRADVTVRFPLSPEMDACCAVEALRELPSQGIRLRTRALTTTLFARLCLADLFVHGIGGAKYDEMTDRIISRFFGLPAPTFAAISATLHLPLATPFEESAADLRHLQHDLRDLRFNSDRWLDSGQNANVDTLIAEKQKLIAAQHAAKTTGLSHRERRARSPLNHERFLRFQQVDEQLAGYTAAQQAEIRDRMDAVQQHLAANAVLTNREFSFALFPEEALRPFLTGLFSGSSRC